MSQTPNSALEASAPRRFYFRGYRWAICGALFAITSINYLDRFTMSLLKPQLQQHFHFTQVDYGYIAAAFSAMYAIGYGLCGVLMDGLGVWLGFALTVLVFSLAQMGMAAMTTVVGYMVLQGIMGLAQGANFPGAIKAVGQWFPRKERALTTGIFNAGTSLGVVTAPAIAWLVLGHLPWQSVFVVAGALGFLWLAWWLPRYKDPEKNPQLSAAELQYIRSDTPAAQMHVPWRRLLLHKQTWAYVIGTMMTSPVWWFFLFWIPGFFHDKEHVNLKHMLAPMVIIYGMADLGSIGGGALSSWFLRSGWSLNAARKAAMLICALVVTPVFFTSHVHNVYLASILVGMACAGHQGFSANLFTMASDTMPMGVVGSVVGLGGLVASGISIFVSVGVGWLLHETHNRYWLIFAIASSAYLIALLLIHIINPRWQAANDDFAASGEPPASASGLVSS